MSYTTGDTHTDTTKKRPRSEVHTKDDVISKKKKKKKCHRDNDNSSYAVEISNASSAAMLPLISSSIYSISDGIPRRELKLIVSEARTCEDVLERELRLLRQALLIERQKRKPKTIDAAVGNSEEANDTNTNTDTSVNAKKSDDDTSTSAYNIPVIASTDKDGTSKNIEEKGIVTSASSIAVTKSLTDDSNRTMTPTQFAALKTMIESEITPPDTHWTISALLGRLRHELTTPLPPSSQLHAYREKAGLQQLVNSVGLSYSSKKKRATNMTTSATTSTINSTESTTATSSVGNSTNGTLELSQFKRLALLPDHLEFFREHATPDKLLVLWKKLSAHRSSLVFRRPVNPKEAPGYSDRIRFPMDLSLVRKLIVSRNIKNYHGILQRVHLIGHNCVKYNGRESDYALVTREFESVATEYIFTAVTAGCNYKGGSRTTSPVIPLAPSTSFPITIITVEPKNSVVKVSLAVGGDTS